MKALKREFEILKALGGSICLAISYYFTYCLEGKQFVDIFDWWVQSEPPTVVWISEMVSCTIWKYVL
jgi:hypothetical protein